jgi:hypothetical protein
LKNPVTRTSHSWASTLSLERIISIQLGPNQQVSNLRKIQFPKSHFSNPGGERGLG